MDHALMVSLLFSDSQKPGCFENYEKMKKGLLNFFSHLWLLKLARGVSIIVARAEVEQAICVQASWAAAGGNSSVDRQHEVAVTDR